MKTVVYENEKVVVAENAQEALKMFKRALAKRKAIVQDDGEDRGFYNREEDKEYSSFKSNKNYYDYGLD